MLNQISKAKILTLKEGDALIPLVKFILYFLMGDLKQDMNNIKNKLNEMTLGWVSPEKWNGEKRSQRPVLFLQQWVPTKGLWNRKSQPSASKLRGCVSFAC